MRRMIPFLIALLAFCGASLGERFLEGPSEEEVPGAGIEVLEPGEFAGTVLLGGFRAVALDMLWVRALNRYEQGDYYEVLSLYKAITKLQPRNEMAWMQGAYVMVLDIPPDRAEAEVRYGWIKRGLRHLRQAIDRNPSSSGLPKLLADIVFLKLTRRETELRPLFEADEVTNPEGYTAREAALHWYGVAIQKSERPSGSALWGAMKTVRDGLLQARREFDEPGSRMASAVRFRESQAAARLLLGAIWGHAPEWELDAHRLHDALQHHKRWLAEVEPPNVPEGVVPPLADGPGPPLATTTSRALIRSAPEGRSGAGCRLRGESRRTPGIWVLLGFFLLVAFRRTKACYNESSVRVNR